MKHAKKLASLLLALVMVLALATTAFAYDITLSGTDKSPTTGHTYKVYQIFTGDLSDKILSNVKYGANYGETGKSVPATELDAIQDADAFARDLVGNGKLHGDPVAILTAENNWKATGLVAGYYLIVDEGGNIGEGDAYSAYIVKVVDDITINPKSEAPTLDKTITADDNAIDNDIATDGKSDNVSIGSKVTYTLTGTIPASASNYDYYYYIINDTLSDGLSFDDTSVTVTIGGVAATINVDYKLFTGDDAEGHTFQVALLNAKANAGKTVVVTYKATLNKDAVIGEVNGNPNTADLTYSNNPNYTYNGSDTDKNGKPDEGQSVPTGDTPDSITRTYTTGIKLLKVDEDGLPLTGAEFQITGTNVKIVLVSEETFIEDAEGTYWKLKTGAYTTQEPQLTDKYVEKTDNRDGGYVNEGETYREATAEELADESVQLYTLVKANAGLYANTDTKYKKTIVLHQEGAGQTETDVKAYVGADGVLVFEGLGEGTYTIKETKTPAGYNTISDITVVIEWDAPATNSNNCTWSAKATVNGKESTLSLNSEGIFELEVVNEKGTLLPETGGIGTTIFYVVGSVLLIGAVVLLVTKKRMSAAEK